MPELKKIEKYIKNETEYSRYAKLFYILISVKWSHLNKNAYIVNIFVFRDDIRCTLTVVLSLFSCGNLLAQWDGEPLLAVLVF